MISHASPDQSVGSSNCKCKFLYPVSIPLFSFQSTPQLSRKEKSLAFFSHFLRYSKMPHISCRGSHPILTHLCHPTRTYFERGYFSLFNSAMVLCIECMRNHEAYLFSLYFLLFFLFFIIASQPADLAAQTSSQQWRQKAQKPRNISKK